MYDCIIHVFCVGDHTKISLNTRNVFIDITATDLTKVSIMQIINTQKFRGKSYHVYTLLLGKGSAGYLGDHVQ